MIRSLKALAIAAAVVGGALGATAAQASAANFTVYFAVQDNDASNNMGLFNVPSSVTGLSAGPISPGATDPSAGGHGVWSDTLPPLGQYKSVPIQAGVYSNDASPCSFTLQISHDSNPKPYLLQISVDTPSRCTVPTISNPRTTDGQFTSQTYILGWTS